MLVCCIRQDEFDCENAVSHLEQCCPDFPAGTVDCTYSGGCMPTGPVFNTAESDCIRGSSCSSLRAGGACDLAAKLARHESFGDVCTGRAASSAFPCSTTSNCGPGLVCCASQGALEEFSGSAVDASAATTCLAAPCAFGAPLCELSSECASEEVCAYFSLSSTVGTCTPADGSSFGDSSGSSGNPPRRDTPDALNEDK
jgi:hypothetical protein